VSTIKKARTIQPADFVHPELADLGRTGGKVAPLTWAATRIGLGFIFAWAFLDKTFGLGLATPTERAWVNGGSPTAGFLGGVEGTFAGFFNALAGQAWADWLFMAGLAGIGTALVAGVALRIATGSGVVILVLMWLASLPLANNPFLDDHLIYALVLVGLAAAGAGDTLGLGKAWARLPLVHRFPILK
jgi:thiosulfate dehydrogenase [quinone] large subunit